MKNHILLDKAFVYPIPKNKPEMNGCHFDAIAGYWKDNADSRPIIHNANRPKPQSKKSDVETGEDRKGE